MLYNKSQPAAAGTGLIARLSVLRHAFGAVVIQEKHLDAQVVSKLLGHSDVSTTYKYYSDVYADILAQSVDAFKDIDVNNNQ